MFDITAVMIQNCIDRLIEGYYHVYGSSHSRNLCSQHIDVLQKVATLTLSTLAFSDAPYHDIEHTILVTLVGQDILRGKQRLEGNVTPEDWLHFIVGLLCHDIGYVKGVCRLDRRRERLFVTGKDCKFIALPIGATDASLAPYHVDRSQQFVDEHLTSHPSVEGDRIKDHIEFTRFPVPAVALYQDTHHYPGLTRAADLIGQLSDPRYLQKLPTLFYEFQEIGMTERLGYRHPSDMRAAYPSFYRNIVRPLIQDALLYLEATQDGRQTIRNLKMNLYRVECDRPLLAA
ncbi:MULTISPECIES: metal-dependent phosphohydrolase [unclassified Leptolyngbya]|uniref:metal-dependent phosphohydrolase n=1 Tax=unclassified Leptolyngbya TaxID=2650499 RepID=UPI001682AD5B|nr:MULTISPECIES: metal-dependent phosphohydrolase [unclassified Leptolyngbya]MBD1912577.1 metal-dependent phosphohydrolase [Leptolyngbya sp. FACHB-8]MBD2158487.1 metal-dependent phosphohydrolase [Leptolyngbya sp. FACHB-16]